MKRQAGFTLIELLIVVAIISIIAAIATPRLLRARMAANEASAISSIKAIGSAQAAFASTCASGGYAVTIADLLLAPPGGVPFVDVSLTSGIKSGYNVNLMRGAGAVVILAAGAACNGAAGPAVDRYVASAWPIQVGATGQRSFASDERVTVYQDPTGAAFPNPIPAGAATLQ